MRYATPFITGLFVISLVSGVALFFHVGQNYFREMHEWLSMVLILPFILHLARNWRPFLAYFRRMPMVIALVISVAAGGYYAWEGTQGGPGGNPAMAMVGVLQSSPLSALAPVFGHTPESMAVALAAKGYKVDGPEKSIADIATASGKDRFDVIRDIVAVKK
jgi:uncharacterized membrane protein YfcA